ncbi:MAG TPA: hypothetical protein VJ499_12845 [Flavisolibacter sp.]|nr:hypothetical protein [Flavisolibacter sp.]
MKYFLILMVLTVLFSAKLFAQSRSDVKLYAYARAVTGGVMPKISTQENGSQTMIKPKTKYSYLFYLEGPKKLRIYPVELWVKGERLGVKSTAVNSTPVEISIGELPQYAKTTTLVPKTNNKVIKLDPAIAVNGKNFPKAKAKAETNEVVLVYKYGGKFYYAVQDKIKLIDPIVLQ